MPAITNEFVYLLLIFGLLVIPRALQRFRIPAPLTSFAVGMVAAVFLVGFSQDATLALLSALGISSLFLFAGLEVQMEDLRRGMWPLLTHLVARALSLSATAYLGITYLELSWQVATLDIRDPANCLWRFKSNRDVGIAVFVGLLADTTLSWFAGLG